METMETDEGQRYDMKIYIEKIYYKLMKYARDDFKIYDATFSMNILFKILFYKKIKFLFPSNIFLCFCLDIHKLYISIIK